MDIPKTFEKSNSSQKTNKYNEIDKMRDALTSIACEMQRFQESSSQSQSTAHVSSDCNDQEKVLAELLKCKTKIKSKRNRIQELKKNLQAACFVAKVAASANNENSGSLKRHLGSAQSNCQDLLEKYKSNIQIINSLSRENEILRNKLDSLANIIRLGHEELLKIRSESSEETSILVQLKQLIECCGEYYASYCNEHNKCLRLKQENVFLGNKNRILEKNVEALSEQLKMFRLKKENDRIKNTFTKSKLSSTLTIAFSEVNMKSRDKNGLTDAANEDKYKRHSSDSHNKPDSEQDFDLTPHLSLVNKLLSDQETLLRDLKVLSEEFRKENPSWYYLLISNNTCYNSLLSDSITLQ